MLSATSTQSPLATVSSVFTMPTVSSVSVANNTGISGLHDQLFTSVPSVGETNSTHTVTDIKPEINGTISAISSQPQQLFGQPQVAPQFFIAGQPLTQGQTTGSSLPVQQLLIPVSTGNGTQQFISIPVSLATGGNQQIQLLTTSNGQIIATNLSSLQGLAQPLNMTAAAAAATSSATAAGTGASGSVNSHTPNGNASSQQTSGQTLTNQVSSLPQLLTNAQGQILAVGPQQVLTPVSVPHVNSTTSNTSNQHQNNSSAASNHSTGGHLGQQGHSHGGSSGNVSSGTGAASNNSGSNSGSSSGGAAVGGSSSSSNPNSGASIGSSGSSSGGGGGGGGGSNGTSSSGGTHQQINQNSIHSSVVTGGSGSVVGASQQQPHSVATTTVSQQPTATRITVAAQSITSHTTTSEGLPPNVSQLLPNTVSNSTESTTVDGINLDEIKEFAKQFKIRRLSLGLTQTQVGQALSATEGPAYSQSAICRFEKLDITPKSAQKIKPVLERWMAEAEERYKNGVQNLTDFIGSEPSKKRKRRTSFTPQALEILNQHFEKNTHPSGAELTELSENLSYDREVVRVWFCNKRQALKNTIKLIRIF